MRAPDVRRTTTCTCLIDLPPELLTAICGFVECRTVVQCRSVAHLFLMLTSVLTSIVGMQANQRHHRCVARTAVPYRARTRRDDRRAVPLDTDTPPPPTAHDGRPSRAPPSTATRLADAHMDALRDGADARPLLCVRARWGCVLQDAAWGEWACWGVRDGDDCCVYWVERLGWR